MLMALAARYNLQRISQLDVETAYLNGKIDTEVYMEKPDLLRESIEKIILQEEDSKIADWACAMLKKIEEPDSVCRLNKVLYGLRQSGRQWHIELEKTLCSIGLIPIHADPCVYIDSSNQLFFVLIYVEIIF